MANISLCCRIVVLAFATLCSHGRGAVFDSSMSAEVIVEFADQSRESLGTTPREGGIAIPSSASLWFVVIVEPEPLEFEALVKDMIESGAPGLHVIGRSLEDHELASIGKIGSLTYVDVAGTRAGPLLISALARLRGLRHIDVSRCQVDESDVESLSALQLESLSVSGCGLHTIAVSFPSSLRYMSLADNQIDGSTLEQLAGCGQLRALDLSLCSRIGGNDLRRVSDLAALETLDLSDCPVSDDGVRFLSRHTSMRDLRLDRSDVTDEAVLWICSNLPNLEVLSLESVRLGDRALSSISKLKSLRELNIRGANRLTDSALVPLSQAKSLHKLWLPGGRSSLLTREAVDALRAQLPNCAVVAGAM